MATLGAAGIGGGAGLLAGRKTPAGGAADTRGENLEMLRLLKAEEEANRAAAEERARPLPDDPAELSKMLSGLSKKDPRYKEITAKIAERDAANVEALRRQAEQRKADEEKAATSAFADPQAQMVMREAAVEGETALPVEEEAPAVDTMTQKQARAAGMPAGQRSLPFDVPEPKLRRKGEGAKLPPEPPTPTPEPTAPSMGQLDPDKPLTLEDLQGLAPANAKRVWNWLNKNVVGKTQREVVEYVQQNPGMVSTNSGIAVALRELTSIAQPPYAESGTDVRSESETDGQPAESGVGAPTPAATEPDTTTADTEGAPPSDGAGVADVSESTGEQSMVEGSPPAPLDPIEAVESAKTEEEYQQALEGLAEAFRTGSETVSDYIEQSFNDDPAFARDFKAAEARLRSKKRLRPEMVGGQNVTVPELTEAVQAGDTRAALQVIVQSPEATPAQREVAKRLLQYRSLPQIKVVPGLKSDGAYDAATDTVELKTITPHTVLHEVVHAGVHREIMAVEGGVRQNPGVRKLRAVYEHVYKVRPDLRKTYGMSNISEFASESMSNTDFQNELRTIPYQQTNAFTAFARAIAQMFGFAGTSQNTAAAEAIIAVDQIMLRDSRGYQESQFGNTSAEGVLLDAERQPVGKTVRAPVFNNIVQSSELMREQPGSVQRAYGKTLQFMDTSNGLTPATKFRAYVTDNMAGVAALFDSVWGGKVRSSLGQLNPMVAARSAQDFSKKLEALYIEGGLSYDAALGDFVAARQQDVPSMTDIWDAVKKWGAANGKSFDVAYAEVSKMLEAVRLNELRQSNATGNTDIPIHKLSQKDPRSPDDQIDAALAELARQPDVKAIGEMVDKSREHFIDFMVAQGRISKEQAAEWKSAVGYVPFARVQDLESTFRAATTGKKGLAKFRDLPDLIGSSTREVGNVIDNHLSLISWMAQEGVKARTTRNMLYTMRTFGAADRVSPAQAKRMPKTAVMSYEQGEQIWFNTADPLYALAFREQGPLMGTFSRALQQVAQVLRSTITLMPPFIASQVVQDIQRAMIASGVQNPWTLPKSIIKNFLVFSWADITGKRHPLVEEMATKGIAGGYDIDLQNPALSALQELGYRKRSALQKIPRLADGLLRASDLAVRQAIYQQTLKESGDAALALQRGREIINFRRRGAAGTVSFLVATVPFVNAYMQSMDLLYRNAMGTDNSMGINRNQARARLMQQLATVAAFSMIYALMMSDDEEYNNMELRERNKHFLIPGLDVKIPVPPEWAAVAKVPAEMFVEYVRKDGTPEELYAMEAVKAVFGAVLEAVGAPLPIPAALRPVLEAFTNYSFFTGDQLEGTYQRTLDPSQRVNYRTSEFSRVVAEAAAGLGFDVVSPIMIDHLITGYTATTGSTLLAMTDALLNPDRMDRPIYKTFMASTFIYDPIGSRADREFYDFAEKVMPKARTLNEMLKTNPDGVEAYAEKHAAALEAAEFVGAAIQQLGEMRKYEKYLRSDLAAEDGMSQEERQAALDELRAERSEYLAAMREVKAQYYATKSATP